jgi:Cys-rich four helix bundle protein (predicted Tat secretion target)
MKQLSKKMNRKDFLTATTGLMATALVSGIAAADKKDEHAGHHMHHDQIKHAALIASALDCLNKAQICVDHCIDSLRAKDLSLVDCLASAREMIPLCTTLSALATYESKQLSAFAKVCISACTDCMKECDKHAKMHQACADCAQSCRNCISECKKVA